MVAQVWGIQSSIYSASLQIACLNSNQCIFLGLMQFNFLGKDSIRYENTVEVELPVYNAILKFQKGMILILIF